MGDKSVSGMRRLKQWLIDQIDSGHYPGLVWDDEEKNTFRIPWKHAGKQDYIQEVDASIFKAWAIFKGKFKEGDRAEPATWKTRLRCALNKSPDFEEALDRSQLDISEPYKVYRIIPEGQQKGKSCSQSEMVDISSYPSHQDEMMKEQSFVDYSGIIKRSHSPPQENCTTHQQQDWWRLSGYEETPMIMSYRHGCEPTHFSLGAEFCHMLITFYYGGVAMSQASIRQSEGCRITVRPIPINGEIPYGPETMEPILFPTTQKILNLRQQIVTNKLLTHLDRGVLLLSNDEGIYIKRLCQGRVFWSGPCAPFTDRPNKLDRDAVVKLFDTKLFLQACHLYSENQILLPHHKVIICFGEEYPDSKPISKKLITVEIEQVKARQILDFLHRRRNFENPNLQISSETSEDKLSGIMHELCMTTYGNAQRVSMG
ncbi:interferon regulatory factor 8 [Callorhinchus milii]|uniref:Interferon regulatory factor 8 n=1 Tax=Callorhinchus milii TaxID=7868 RepID=V9KQT3_CALMI|nr:interferon regulatory factor 8 [Callorhinchus milii]|eukprot:gi/632944284/ref/XP_007887425.1/ PREDICTED: interferon regulatory factor 8 [Callorhinchus milii]